MIITPKRNLLQRAANRALHRFGLKPFPIAFESSLADAGKDPRVVFNAVYAASYWGDRESKSGSGSEIAATANYRPQLVAAIRDLGVRSMFDAPCGDLNWMTLVLDQVDLAYIGGDIADEALAVARLRRPDLDLRRFDICQDNFPTVDLWHCRQTMFHLSFADIRRALDRAMASDIRFAAMTTHRARLLRNLDIKSGGFRLLDLERPPFSLPPPLRYLKDYAPGQFPQFVGIWPTAELRKACSSN